MTLGIVSVDKWVVERYDPNMAIALKLLQLLLVLYMGVILHSSNNGVPICSQSLTHQILLNDGLSGN